MMNIDQARAWRAEQTRKSVTFCEWCISKATRHTQICPTKQEGFDAETTPKLTLEERNNLIKQKDEAINKGKGVNSKPVAAEGKLHGDDNKVGSVPETGDQTGGDGVGKDEVGERSDSVEHVTGEGK